MTVTREDLADFSRFVDEKLSNGGSELTMEYLVIEWKTVRERAATNTAINEALEQMDAGLGQPLDEAMAEIQKQLNIPSE